MAAAVTLELDPIFLKALGYLHSKSKDSAERLKALLDESMARGSDSSYRSAQKDTEAPKISVTKPVSSKQDQKATCSLSSSNNNGKSGVTEKVKKETEKRAAEKIKVDPSEGPDPQKKPRLEKTENRSSPITVQTSKDLSLPDLSSLDETNADDFAMEMGLACVVCRQMTVLSGNQLVECQECHNLYHQDCHKPQVTDKEVNDPRLVWYCARCTRQMKRMAQKTQKPPQKPVPSVTAAPIVKDPLVKKPELKPKQETATTFQAFKRTEVKTSTAASGNSSSASASSSSTSGLTGWAAFAAKTSSGGPATAKLGSASQSNSGKTAASSANQKPVGLSGLATSKAGLGSKLTPSGSSNSSSVPSKPPPPLTLGKPGLSRSSSNDGVNKAGLPSPSGSATSSSGQAAAGNGTGAAGSGGNNGAKTAAESQASSSGAKVPTSQESHLNAMKRLQMVKKKAAQKKLKK
ncbi:integrator complex subunit 12 [Latimeria chalumnae]|uniref:integrator complex subunit 12 n=1 Tax=Latimeria chalumnae TaxID=7897 RepID=UPI00313E44B2